MSGVLLLLLSIRLHDAEGYVISKLGYNALSQMFVLVTDSY
jgi:hypothetical protein